MGSVAVLSPPDMRGLYLSLIAIQSAAALSIQGKTLTVTTVQHEPWLKLKDDSSNKVGNDRFEGFVMDLLENLGNKTGASFQVSLQRDGRYGGPDEAGQWSGMVGSVMAGEVDLAVADITQTAYREAVVDFTVPFDQVGITILYPVSFGYIYPNTAWETKPFTSVADLVSQDHIKFTTMRGGATHNFFKNSRDPDMMQAFLKMTEEDSFVSHNREGIEKVLSGEGKFAYFMESAGAEYAMAQNCGLSTVGGNINTRNYGIVTQKDSAYRKVLNIALLELMDEGLIQKLKQKWWRSSQRNCNNRIIQKLSDWVL